MVYISISLYIYMIDTVPKKFYWNNVCVTVFELSISLQSHLMYSTIIVVLLDGHFIFHRKFISIWKLFVCNKLRAEHFISTGNDMGSSNKAIWRCGLML